MSRQAANAQKKTKQTLSYHLFPSHTHTHAHRKEAQLQHESASRGEDVAVSHQASHFLLR